MLVPLAISYISNDGSRATPAGDGSSWPLTPCMNVLFGFGPTPRWEHVTGMIDTGASPVLAAPELVRRHGCPQIKGPTLIHGPNQSMSLGEFEVLIGIADPARREMHGIVIPAVAFDLSGSGCQLVLGRRFLRHVQMFVNGPASEITAAFDTDSLN